MNEKKYDSGPVLYPEYFELLHRDPKGLLAK